MWPASRTNPWFGTVAVVLGLGIVPGTASAHGAVTSQFQAPLPLRWLFLGAGATILVTAIWLSYSDRLSADPITERPILVVPDSVLTTGTWSARLAFLVLFGLVIADGVFGQQRPTGNLATVFTWPVWFHGLAIAAILTGLPWERILPWRALFELVSVFEDRPLGLGRTVPGHLGSWPAVVGFVALIGIVENLTVFPRSPQFTAALLAAYTVVMLAGALVVGRTWFSRADPLGVFYRLFARVAPFRLAGQGDGPDRLVIRPPWQGCTAPVASQSLAVFAVLMVYTVSFDGFTNTRAYESLLFTLGGLLGTGSASSLWIYLVGVLAFVASFAAVAWLAERLGNGESKSWPSATRGFAPTILPIAAAYEIAHSYPWILRNVGRIVELLVHPLLPGIGDIQPLFWLSVPIFWGSQVLLIILGHVVAVVAAHRVAQNRYGTGSAARRSHVPMIAVMVGYTVLSLWIVSQPIVQ